MQLAIIAAVVVTLVAAERSPFGPVTHANLKTVAVVVVMAIVVAAAHGMTRLTVRALNVRPAPPRVIRHLYCLSCGHVILWLSASAVILTVLDWPKLAQYWSGSNSVLCDELLLLTPVMMPLVLSWAAFYDIDRVRGADVRRPAFSRWDFVCFSARQHLILPLTPVILLVAVKDVVQVSCPDLLRGQTAWLVHVLPLVAVTILFPVLLRNIWPTERLADGPLRTRLEATCRQSGIQVREILIWCSQGRLANAAVCGLLPQLRYVLVSDELIRRLSPRQIEAVFAHELGHVRHHHLLKTLFVLSVPLLVVLSMSIGSELDVSNWFAGQVPFLPAWNAGAAAACSLGYVALALGAYSRLIEREADVWAVEHLSAEDGTVESATRMYVETLELLAASNGDGGRALDWLHPTLASRRRFLQQAVGDNRGVLRLRAGLRLVHVVLLSLVLFPPFWRYWADVPVTPADVARSELNATISDMP